MQTTAYQPTVFFVRSSGNPNTFYRLMADTDGALRCECRAAIYNRKPCRHVRAVVAGQCLAATPKRATATRTHATATDETRDLISALDV